MKQRSACHSWALAAFTAFLLTADAPSAMAKVKRGDRAAELGNVRDGRGRKVKLRSLRGKVVVLTFGASWCAPCKRELPAWDKLSKKYSKKEVVFVAVNIDNSKARGKKFVRDLGVKHMVVGYDPGKGTADTYDPPTMPTTYVIDKKGIVRDVHSGYRRGDSKKLAAVIEKYRR